MSWSGETDGLPADVTAAAAVDRVSVKPYRWSPAGEEAQRDFDTGLLQRWLHGRETHDGLRGVHRCLLTGAFDGREDAILLVGIQFDERLAMRIPAAPIEVRNAVDIRGAQDVYPLLPGLRASSAERLESAAVRLGVDPVDPGQVAVQEVDGARSAAPGVSVVLMMRHAAAMVARWCGSKKLVIEFRSFRRAFCSRHPGIWGGRDRSGTFGDIHPAPTARRLDDSCGDPGSPQAGLESK